MRAAMVTGIVLSLVLAPPARAANPSSDAEPLPATADPISEVRTLYELGMAGFQSAEYDQALIMWKRAFVLLPHDLAQQTTRAALVANIVAAHSRAYEVGRNPEHLAEAMRVVDLRKAELAQLQGQDEAVVSETASLDAQRTELARLYEVALSQGEQPAELPAGTAFRIEAPPPPALTRKQIDATIAADHELGREFRRSKAMADAGFVVLMLGVGGVPITFLANYGSLLPKHGYADPVPFVISLGAVVGVTGIVGGTLFGVGSKRRKQIRAEYDARPSHLARLPVPIPLTLPHGGGLGFVGRF